MEKEKSGEEESNSPCVYYEEEGEEEGEVEEEEGEWMGLTKEDWGLLIIGSRGFSYIKNQTILTEGEVSFGLYQIASGTVRVEKKVPGKKSIVVAKLSAGEIFGEMSLMMYQNKEKKEGGVMQSGSQQTNTACSNGTAAGASVIADTPDVDVYFMSGEYLLQQFEKDERLSGRFFHYLCNCLSQRLLRTINQNLQ
uniref:Cyclic nucleotide-binding domain-containing protein n=1 Tax=Paramoeba aestuarina TaxID=180227 RepID=A0A7S4NJH7_9EUKA|mmetsp:Transcript_17673/g.27669  ORF Transcript_17673/g.27669 Transcript_17673/m.27669 type:complete len:195 (+) Transcript_17673:94-678(+)